MSRSADLQLPIATPQGRPSAASPGSQGLDQKADDLGPSLLPHPPDDPTHEGAVDREELQGANLAGLRQPTLGHPPLVQGHRIPAPGDLGRHPADHEVLAVDDEDKSGAALDRRQVREGERDRDQGPRADSQRNPASHIVPDVVLGVLPQVPQGLFGSPEERAELVLQDPLDVGLLAQDESVSRLEEHEVRVSTEPVSLADLLRNHNLALARHPHDVHGLVSQVLLHKPSPGWRECA